MQKEMCYVMLCYVMLVEVRTDSLRCVISACGCQERILLTDYKILLWFLINLNTETVNANDSRGLWKKPLKIRIGTRHLLTTTTNNNNNNNNNNAMPLQGVHLPVPAAVRGTTDGKCGLISKHVHSSPPASSCIPLFHCLNFPRRQLRP